MNSANKLIDELEKLLELLKVKETNKKLLKNKNNLLELSNQMITPGRSNNFILPVDETLVIKILEESFS